MAEKTGILIMGGGVAGSATAYFLAERGYNDFILLEKEIMPGMHSSGRNASMMRQNVPEELNCRLAYESMEFFRRPPKGFPDLEFQENGSLLLASGEHLQELRDSQEMHERIGLEIQEWTPQKALQKIPVLNPSQFESAFFCPSDGTINVVALIQGYLAGAKWKGAQIRTGCAVEGFLTDGNRVTGVKTSRGDIYADRIVNAAGAWAGNLMSSIGITLPIRPCRRHLIVTQPLSWVESNWPFTWHVSGNFYFRPDSGGLLMSPCDEEEFPACNIHTAQELIDETARKAKKLLPKLGDVEVYYSWAGLRNLTPDHFFIVGPDSNWKGLFWVAGLGGHGVTASPALGKAAAEMILEGKTTLFDVAAMAPARFSKPLQAKSSVTRDALL